MTGVTMPPDTRCLSSLPHTTELQENPRLVSRLVVHMVFSMMIMIAGDTATSQIVAQKRSLAKESERKTTG